MIDEFRFKCCASTVAQAVGGMTTLLPRSVPQPDSAIWHMLGVRGVIAAELGTTKCFYAARRQA
jgi:hypothetical protein